MNETLVADWKAPAMTAEHLYDDTYGEVIDRPLFGFIEIRWFDTTAEMTPAEYERWMLRFADLLGNSDSKRVLVDSTALKSPNLEGGGSWWDDEFIPRCNSAAISRFAFHVPTRTDRVGVHPVAENPAEFPIGHFTLRSEATEWLVT